MMVVTHMFGGGGLFGLFMLPTLIIAAVVVFVLSTQSLGHARSHVSSVDQAVEIVRQRFARGEIDAEEYNRVVSGLTRTQ
jgi:uncharacterized membrane protein